MNEEVTSYREDAEYKLEKIQALRNLGIDPYDGNFRKTHDIEEIRNQFEDLVDKDVEVKIAGRIMALRKHGKAVFADLQDRTGKIQVYFRKDNIGENNFTILREIEVGDVIGVEGKVFRTHVGELTILVENFTLLSKCLHPLPEKWHGLKEVEVRYRKRYLDLMMNPNVRKVFYLRFQLVKELRDFLAQRGFWEVETPMMQAIPGGALARPFKTFHNALGIELYLRIAPELFLKRLIVGGLEKVYEINRSFRNEGISTRHNPEFTMLELYQAYADYQVMMELAEEMLSQVVKKIVGSYQIEYQSMILDFTPPWKRISLPQAIQELVGVDIVEDSLETIRAKTKERGMSYEDSWDRGKFVNEFLEQFVQPLLVNPTFVFDYPVEISPLARAKKDNPQLAERFELFIGKEEVGNAYSELNDPFEQKKRFVDQLKKREEGDLEAHLIDEDYIEALEYGMPPTGGLGIGIDRLMMLITNSSSIREVILFPLLRPSTD
ncbi:MAG: lysine--tRNA ligase [Candidatus Atribacteria bacterium]|nr:lysine--tRNA ligase [Candidatus Atribacteria bacterium]